MSANLSCLSLSEDQIQPPYTCIRGFNSGNSSNILYMTRMSQLIISYPTKKIKKYKKHIVSWCSCHTHTHCAVSTHTHTHTMPCHTTNVPQAQIFTTQQFISTHTYMHVIKKGEVHGCCVCVCVCMCVCMCVCVRLNKVEEVLEAAEMEHNRATLRCSGATCVSVACSRATHRPAASRRPSTPCTVPCSTSLWPSVTYTSGCCGTAVLPAAAEAG